MPMELLQIKEMFYSFLNTSTKYLNILHSLINTNNRIFLIDLIDLQNYSNPLFLEVVSNFYIQQEELFKGLTIFIKQHSQITDWQLAFTNLGFVYKFRDLKSKKLGSLISFNGTVTRTTVVKPELNEAVFVCQVCHSKSKKIVQEFKYTEPLSCTNTVCTNRKSWGLELKECSFYNWQKAIVQESSNEIPPGALPRTIEIILRNELVELIRPGSTTLFTGCLIVVPDDVLLMLPQNKTVPLTSGITNKINVKNLNQKFVFLCNNIKMNETKEVNFNEAVERILFHETEKENFKNNIFNFSDGIRGIYDKISESLFPNIFGHRSIKNAILLMLVGGVSKQTPEKIKLRGDLNILLVGDPGTAKSQFLKQTSKIMDRSIYTSGKSSSAAGLTACVVKDENNEYTIEAGALMLSDNGYCCIDEFDKMNYKDQVSIHEAMEQQTISINKAGINATLNAKCSILAAANPIHGRYDKKKNLKQNINLSAPIMSRFDLYFVLIDEIERESDENIANFILNNHLKSKSEKYFNLEDVVIYLKYCKQLQPVMLEESRELLLNKYITLRQESLISNNNYKITVRNLESIIRLSEALAKVHCDLEIKPFYVEEAFRLIKSSVIEIKNDDLIIEPNKQISHKDYERITNSVIYILKTKDNLKKESLINEYLLMMEDNLNNESEYNCEKKRVEDCVDYLLEKEGVLFETSGILFVHPNFDV